MFNTPIDRYVVYRDLTSKLVKDLFSILMLVNLLRWAGIDVCIADGAQQWLKVSDVKRYQMISLYLFLLW